MTPSQSVVTLVWSPEEWGLFPFVIRRHSRSQAAKTSYVRTVTAMMHGGSNGVAPSPVATGGSALLFEGRAANKTIPVVACTITV